VRHLKNNILLYLSYIHDTIYLGYANSLLCIHMQLHKLKTTTYFIHVNIEWRSMYTTVLLLLNTNINMINIIIILKTFINESAY